jgi:predicted nucleic acid-binding protein
MIILDTNVVSELMVTTPAAAVLRWLDQQPWTSLWTTAITVFEIRSGLAVMPGGRRRTERQAAFDLLIERNLEFRILSFDHAAAEEAASLTGARQRAGRPGESRDTMIAGIALAQRATLATRNVRHFDDLSVPVVDPWQHR